MSTQYSACGGLGIAIRWQDIPSVHRTKVAEKFHMEDRYDSHTGKKLKQMKIIDEDASYAITFGGKTFNIHEAELDSLFEVMLDNRDACVTVVYPEMCMDLPPDLIDDEFFLWVQADQGGPAKQLETLVSFQTKLTGLGFTDPDPQILLWIEIG